MATANRQHIYNAKPFGSGTMFLATVRLGLNYILETKLSSETSAYHVSWWTMVDDNIGGLEKKKKKEKKRNLQYRLYAILDIVEPICF